MSGTPTKIKLPGVECESKSPAAPPTPSQAKREQDAAILTSGDGVCRFVKYRIQIKCALLQVPEAVAGRGAPELSVAPEVAEDHVGVPQVGDVAQAP